MVGNFNKKQRISILFSKYLTGSCTKEEAEEILNVLEEPENDNIIKSEAVKFWDEYSDNKKVKNSVKILNDIHYRINLIEDNKLQPRFLNRKMIQFFYRIAAMLFIPVFVYSLYLTSRILDNKMGDRNPIVWQTIKVPTGVQTEFALTDGSHVWLNSGSVFKYPGSFTGEVRNVELNGEAYFNIMKDPDHPFLVKAGNLIIEVKGTQFVVVNYPEDPLIEVILESGQVRLFTGSYKERKLISLMDPGEKAAYDSTQNSISIQKVDIDKYTSWKEGILIFRDDPLSVVTRKLSNRFNVDIELKGLDLNEYVYTATFKNESLAQILELLKITAPIKYTITDQKLLDDNSFTKSKIIITKIK